MYPVSFKGFVRLCSPSERTSPINTSSIVKLDSQIIGDYKGIEKHVYYKDSDGKIKDFSRLEGIEVRQDMYTRDEAFYREVAQACKLADDTGKIIDIHVC